MARGTRSAGGVTIIDVARLAGVSPMTASRVANGEPSVGARSREAVVAAIAQLNYAPNLAARSLVTQTSIRIGVVCSDRSSAFLSEVLVGALDATQAAAAQILLARCDEATPHNEEAIHRLLRAGANGVVLLPPFSESKVFIAALSHAQTPTAVVASGRPVPAMICVRMDDHRAAQEVGELFLRYGHHRVGMIGGDPTHGSSHARRAGFETAMAQAAGSEVLFEEGLYQFSSALTAATALLDDARPPTAIFAANDEMASAAILVAHRRGLDVPSDLSVVGFDNTSIAPALWPPLTTVNQPLQAMAAGAVELLVRRIRSRDSSPPEDRVLAYELIHRQSVAPPGAPPLESVQT